MRGDAQLIYLYRCMWEKLIIHPYKSSVKWSDVFTPQLFFNLFNYFVYISVNGVFLTCMWEKFMFSLVSHYILFMYSGYDAHQ